MQFKNILAVAMALFLGISVLMPGKAMAYTFGVKVINQSGQKIKVRAIRIHKAGAILTGCTDDNNIVISTGDYTLSPQCSAGFDKWKRSIELNFTCVANGYKRQLRFPRGTNKFFPRDHAQKNGDKYIVKVKPNDC